MKIDWDSIGSLVKIVLLIVIIIALFVWWGSCWVNYRGLPISQVPAECYSVFAPSK